MGNNQELGYIAKYDLSGNLIWNKKQFNAPGNSVDADELGNLYETGSFNHTANFGNISLTATPGSYYGDIFITKLSPDIPYQPPVNLVAGTGFDGMVPLTWDTPPDLQLNVITTAPVHRDTYSKQNSSMQLLKTGSNANNSVSYYNVYRGGTGGPYTLIASVDHTGHPYINNGDYIDQDVTNITTYYYAVTAVYPDGETDYSKEVSAKPPGRGWPIDSPLASSVPTIDGVIYPGEWIDAVSVDVTCPDVPATVTAFIKNDGDYLYIAVDDSNDVNMNDENQLVISFDEDHNHTWDSDSLTGEGYFFLSAIKAGFMGIYGEYPDNLGFTDTTLSPDGVVSAISDLSGHLQYEVVIDLTTSELNATPGSTIGFSMFISDPEIVYPHHYGYPGAWPYGYIWPAPSTYGDLKLAVTPDQWDITGSVTYCLNNNLVDDVIIKAVGTSFVDNTDANGDYELLDLPNGNYVVRLEKANDVSSSISAFDAAWILQYEVGIRTFAPYQMIAGDVTGNGEVTAYDAAYILRHGVDLINKFPIMSDTTHFWRFVPEDFAISLSNWTNAPDSIAYTPLSSDTSDNYIGIIYGDVTDNWHPSGPALASLGKVSEGTMDIRLEDIMEKLVKRSFYQYL